MYDKNEEPCKDCGWPFKWSLSCMNCIFNDKEYRTKEIIEKVKKGELSTYWHGIW